MKSEYPELLKEVRIKVLEDAIAKHKESIADHSVCISILRDELIALREEGKENDEQEA